MSREIKFRGKRADGQGWLQGYFFRSWDDTYMAWGMTNGKPDIVKVDPATVGHFTGLKDRDGREIFEGDVVVQDRYKWFDDGVPNYRGTVEWVYSQWQVIAHCINPEKRGISDGINEGLNEDGFNEGGCSEWIVIGNVWDNPDLLNPIS